MRRITFYVFVALITFTLGSFIAFTFFWQSNKEPLTSAKQEVSAARFIDYNQTIPPVEIPVVIDDFPTPFCHDKQILPVWNELKKNSYFKEWEESFFMSTDCADMLEVKYVDLNKDGTQEILLRGKNGNLCSAVGNCGFWIFQKRGKIYTNLLAWSDYSDITQMPDQVQKTVTNDYHNILLKGHISAGDTYYEYFKFNGQKYVQSRCLVDTYVWLDNGKNARKFISCKEFEKR